MIDERYLGHTCFAVDIVLGSQIITEVETMLKDLQQESTYKLQTKENISNKTKIKDVMKLIADWLLWHETTITMEKAYCIMATLFL